MGELVGAVVLVEAFSHNMLTIGPEDVLEAVNILYPETLVHEVAEDMGQYGQAIPLSNGLATIIHVRVLAHGGEDNATEIGEEIMDILKQSGILFEDPIQVIDYLQDKLGSLSIGSLSSFPSIILSMNI